MSRFFPRGRTKSRQSLFMLDDKKMKILNGRAPSTEVPCKFCVRFFLSWLFSRTFFLTLFLRLFSQLFPRLFSRLFSRPFSRLFQFSTSFPTFFSTFLTTFSLACVAGAWTSGRKKKQAHEKGTLPRACLFSLSPTTSKHLLRSLLFPRHFSRLLPPTFFSIFFSTFFSTFSRLFFNFFHRWSHTSKAHSYFEMLRLATFHSWLFSYFIYRWKRNVV